MEENITVEHRNEMNRHLRLHWQLFYTLLTWSMRVMSYSTTPLNRTLF